MSGNEEVTAYINRFDGEVKQKLETLREIITAEAPEAVESLSYGLAIN